MAKFTDKTIAGLKATDKRQLICEGHGFYIQVLPKTKTEGPAVKRWLYRYTLNGAKDEIRLGNYPAMSLAAARTAYGKAREKVVAGINPKAPEVVPPPPDDTTWARFAKEYIARSKSNHENAWYKTVERSLRVDVTPVWGSIPIAEIKRIQGIELFQKLADRAPGQARNAYRVARAVFNTCIDDYPGQYLDSNPILGLAKRVTALETVEDDRVLTKKETRTAWKHLSEGVKRNQRTRDAIKLCLVLMQRPHEIVSMHRSQIEGCWWTMRSANTKNKTVHMVYLTPTALELIGDAQGYIFPSRLKAEDGSEQHILRKTLSSHVSTRKYFGLPRWRPHDLRRTGRTALAELRIQEEHAEAVINHKKKGLVRTYNRHKYVDEKQEAMVAWEQELLRILAAPDEE